MRDKQRKEVVGKTYRCLKENVLKLDIRCFINNLPGLIFDATCTIENNMITHAVHQKRFAREQVVGNRVHKVLQFQPSSLRRIFLISTVSHDEITLTLIARPKHRNRIILETCVVNRVHFFAKSSIHEGWTLKPCTTNSGVVSLLVLLSLGNSSTCLAACSGDTCVALNSPLLSYSFTFCRKTALPPVDDLLNVTSSPCFAFEGSTATAATTNPL
mmetsp:Transcript_15167/g.24780  ORF Transcript_15167/g.24780 Transcript_15167/m.24780 type:complete len:215 (+) Transcript_15167:701-1345(+)